MKILCKKNHNKADMRLFRSIIDDEYRIDRSLTRCLAPCATKSLTM